VAFRFSPSSCLYLPRHASSGAGTGHSSVKYRPLDLFPVNLFSVGRISVKNDPQNQESNAGLSNLSVVWAAPQRRFALLSARLVLRGKAIQLYWLDKKPNHCGI
jgi:hypothetical protein